MYIEENHQEQLYWLPPPPVIFGSLLGINSVQTVQTLSPGPLGSVRGEFSHMKWVSSCTRHWFATPISSAPLYASISLRQDKLYFSEEKEGKVGGMGEMRGQEWDQEERWEEGKV